jgi:hypothetical protein
MRQTTLLFLIAAINLRTTMIIMGRILTLSVRITITMEA